MHGSGAGVSAVLAQNDLRCVANHLFEVNSGGLVDYVDGRLVACLVVLFIEEAFVHKREDILGASKRQFYTVLQNAVRSYCNRDGVLRIDKILTEVMRVDTTGIATKLMKSTELLDTCEPARKRLPNLSSFARVYHSIHGDARETGGASSLASCIACGASAPAPSVALAAPSASSSSHDGVSGFATLTDVPHMPCSSQAHRQNGGARLSSRRNVEEDPAPKANATRGFQSARRHVGKSPSLPNLQSSAPTTATAPESLSTPTSTMVVPQLGLRHDHPIPAAARGAASGEPLQNVANRVLGNLCGQQLAHGAHPTFQPFISVPTLNPPLGEQHSATRVLCSTIGDHVGGALRASLGIDSPNYWRRWDWFASHDQQTIGTLTDRMLDMQAGTGPCGFLAVSLRKVIRHLRID